MRLGKPGGIRVTVLNFIAEALLVIRLHVHRHEMNSATDIFGLEHLHELVPRNVQLIDIERQRCRDDSHDAGREPERQRDFGNIRKQFVIQARPFSAEAP